MYLDPAFGGMLLQISIAIIAVGGGILFAVRRKIRALFSKGKVNNSEMLKSENNNKTTDDVIDTLSDEEE